MPVRAQSLVEYAILIVAVALTVLFPILLIGFGLYYLARKAKGSRSAA